MEGKERILTEDKNRMAEMIPSLRGGISFPAQGKRQLAHDKLVAEEKLRSEAVNMERRLTMRRKISGQAHAIGAGDHPDKELQAELRSRYTAAARPEIPFRHGCAPKMKRTKCP